MHPAGQILVGSGLGYVQTIFLHDSTLVVLFTAHLFMYLYFHFHFKLNNRMCFGPPCFPLNFILTVFFFVLFQRVICRKKYRIHLISRLIVVHGWNGSPLVCHAWICLVSFACPIFFKIGRALWALISNIGLKKLTPNPIGQVPARLGPNSKETKNYSSYSRTAYSYAKIQAHLMYTRVDLQNTKITNKMTNRYKQNDKPLQTKHRKWTNKHKTTKSNIQTHLKQWTHIFVNLFLMPHIWLNLLDSPGVSFFLIFVFFWFRVIFIFV